VIQERVSLKYPLKIFLSRDKNGINNLELHKQKQRTYETSFEFNL